MKVGSALAELLRTIGIRWRPNCPCHEHAAFMDANPEWCESNIETIVGWLRAEAATRRLPFVDTAGRLLVHRAIANARRAASSDSTPNPDATDHS